MKPLTCLSAVLLALGSAQAATTIFSWESGVEGWAANGDPGYSISTSATGATAGLQALRVASPMSSMWGATAANIGLELAQRQAVFQGATTITLDAHYPNPGYTDWFLPPSVALVIQGDGVGWTELPQQELTVDAAPQTLSWTLDPAHASALANGIWAQLFLVFRFGNGGSTGTEGVFYVDNLTSDAAAIPEVSAAALLAAGLLPFLRRRR